MAGAILENLSGRKLSVLVGILLVCQIVCFLIGGLIAPKPANVIPVLATNCIDDENNLDKWFYSRGKGACEGVELNSDKVKDHALIANQIVFVFQIPLPRDGINLDYSRWQQNLIGILEPTFIYQPYSEMDKRVTLTIQARLGYRNKGDADSDWKPYAASIEERTVECIPENVGRPYNCSIIPFFELGSLHHDYYLLNVRFPMDTANNMNMGLAPIESVWLFTINQNGGFTIIWVAMKTIFFPLVISIMIWFWRRVHMLQRKPVLLEQMLLILGCALTLLNAPLEYFTLLFDMPYMLLLSDIRQGIFYAALLSFWLIFAGEHLMLNEAEHSTFRMYWKNLSAIGIGCVSLFIFEMCERGVQLKNPFFSIWVTDTGTNLALTFIILAGISAGLYFIFLSYMIWKVFCNISAKRTILPSMSSMRRLHYEGVIYRFKFLMLATLLCAAMTVIGFILGQVAEGQWKWDDNIHLEYTSAFFTGVYGMWNIYILALIILYAPSHKQWPSDFDSQSVNNEEIEFSRLPTEPSEMTSLAAFARKTTLD